MNDKELFGLAEQKWGREAQFKLAMEECAELIVAINKLDRTGKVEPVIEEMADVVMMIEQLKRMLFCYDRFEIAYKEKIKRLAKRLEVA